jgi:hypothetical protein
MAVPFDRMRQLQDQRVRMIFEGGYELVAFLLSATQDMDGSQHLIYDKVEWTTDPREFAREKDATFHAEGELLLSIEAAKGTT